MQHYAKAGPNFTCPPGVHALGLRFTAQGSCRTYSERIFASVPCATCTVSKHGELPVLRVGAESSGCRDRVWCWELGVLRFKVDGCEGFRTSKSIALGFQTRDHRVRACMKKRSTKGIDVGLRLSLALRTFTRTPKPSPSPYAHIVAQPGLPVPAEDMSHLAEPKP